MEREGIRFKELLTGGRRIVEVTSPESGRTEPRAQDGEGETTRARRDEARRDEMS